MKSFRKLLSEVSKIFILESDDRNKAYLEKEELCRPQSNMIPDLSRKISLNFAQNTDKVTRRMQKLVKKWL